MKMSSDTQNQLICYDLTVELFPKMDWWFARHIVEIGVLSFHFVILHFCNDSQTDESDPYDGPTLESRTNCDRQYSDNDIVCRALLGRFSGTFVSSKRSDYHWSIRLSVNFAFPLHILRKSCEMLWKNIEMERIHLCECVLYISVTEVNHYHR